MKRYVATICETQLHLALHGTRHLRIAIAPQFPSRNQL